MVGTSRRDVLTAQRGRPYRCLFLVPVIVARAPVSGSAVKPTCAVISIPRPIIAIARAEEDAEANWRRRNVKDRTRRRWRRVIVTRRGSAIWLDHICSGVRAHRASKPECEYCQYYDDELFPHGCCPFLLFGRFNPSTAAKFPRKSRPALSSQRIFCSGIPVGRR